MSRTGRNGSARHDRSWGSHGIQVKCTLFFTCNNFIFDLVFTAEIFGDFFINFCFFYSLNFGMSSGSPFSEAPKENDPISFNAALVMRSNQRFSISNDHLVNDGAATRVCHGTEWNGNFGVEYGRCQNKMEWKISRMEWKTIFHTNIPN